MVCIDCRRLPQCVSQVNTYYSFVILINLCDGFGRVTHTYACCRFVLLKFISRRTCRIYSEFIAFSSRQRMPEILTWTAQMTTVCYAHLPKLQTYTITEYFILQQKLSAVPTATQWYSEVSVDLALWCWRCVTFQPFRTFWWRENMCIDMSLEHK